MDSLEQSDRGMILATKINTIDFADVRDYYFRQNPNGHWFDTGTLKCFGSRLPKIAYETEAGVLFISSEWNFNKTQRRFTVRQQRVSGDIKSVAGGFQAYRTRAEALAAIKELHKGATA